MANDRHFLIDPVENAGAPAVTAGRRGMCIAVGIFEADIGAVMDCGYNRVLLERSVDGGLSWQEITTPDQRVVLEREKFDYTVTDRAGEGAFLYRTRYIDTRTNERSEPSEDIEGAGLAIANLLTVEQLKRRYLFGVDLTNDAGQILGDDVFQHYILAAVRSIEHELDTPILPTTFLEFHDYYREDYRAFSFIQLDNYPVISVDEFRVQYPSGQTVVVFPAEWYRLNAEKGQIQIVPTAGTLSNFLVGQGGSFLPAIYNGMDYLPQLFRLEYTAGFGAGRVPRDITEIIGMLASMGPFNIFGDLIAGAGIANLSLSMDGLSQSIGTTASATNAGYGSRIIQYTKQIKEKLPMLRRYYKGVRGIVA
jgi:hypothetical protein